MIVITDSNIIFSYLITPGGAVSKILKSKSNIQFLAPKYLLDEVENHLDKIIVLSSLTKQEIKTELAFLREQIKIYDINTIPKKCVSSAEEILRDIDIDDKYFVALHLYTKHKLWTGDKVLINGLKIKGYDMCITTAELKKSLYKK